MPKRDFIIFWILLLFFSKFSCPGQVWTEFGTKIFFFLFFGQSHPVLAKTNAGKMYFNFLHFFTILFGISCPGQVRTEFGNKFCFFSFLSYLIPFWIKIMPERGILIFWFFYNIFSEFSCPGRVWTEFGSKIFFPLFYRISSRFG